MGAIVLGLAQIVLTEMALGVLFKKLYPTPLFILNAAISLGLIICAVLIPLSKGGPGGLFKDIFKELKNEIKHFFHIIKSDRILLTISILFFISWCYLIFIGYLFPSYTWDALLYHLPIAGFVLQSGAIEQMPDYSLIYLFINIFPKNIELFFLWNLIFLKSDRIVDLSQLFFTLAGMLSIYSMAVKIGTKEKYALYCSLLFFFAPVIILQSTAEYVDIAVSVLLLIAINFLMCGSREEPSLTNRKNITLLPAGVTAGILLGSKGSAPLFVVALSMLFLINEIRKRSTLRREGYSALTGGHLSFKRIIARYVIYFMMPVILLGSYWYIKNWVYYGNPVYPFKVMLFNKTLFRGIFAEMVGPAIPEVINNLSPLNKLLYVWIEKVEYYIYALDIAGFGPLWFILFLPGMGFSVFHAVRKKKYDFLLIAVIIILAFIVYPRNWNPRYVIFILGLGSLSFGALLNYFEERKRILQFVALLLVIYTFFTSISPCITPEKIKEFVGLPAKERTLAKMAPCGIEDSQRENYGLWTWIRDNVSAGETLAYTFHPLLLAPLWNSSFSNKIVFVRSGRLIEWQERLKINNADYVLIRKNSLEDRRFARLEKVRHNPRWSVIYDKFKVLYSDGKYKVLRFVK